MLVDIFSSFDPATNFLFSLNSFLFWIIIPLFIIFLLSHSWMLNNNILPILFRLTSFIQSQLSRRKRSKLKALPIIITSLFIFLILINLIGLIPYIFGITSHLLWTLTLGLPLWLILLISSLFNSPSQFYANFLPSGAPNWLAPPLILIESISVIVRPITLSFRLAANISAGHIVLTLVNIYSSNALIFSFPSLILISVIYSIFEIGICLIQAYIFCLLLSLYADEHST